MARIKIVTDSTADLSEKQIDKYNIKVVPLTVTFGSESFADGVDLPAEIFYQKLTSEDELPKTTQPSPEMFRRVYEETASPEDVIISIHISGKLSGTLNSVEVASGMVSSKVIPVDSKNASQGIGRTVLCAAEAIHRGMSLEETLEIANRSIERTFSVFAVDTLEFLQRNGRIGKAASLAGSLLQIRPVLYADPEGMVAPYDKVRGRSRVIPTLINAALKNLEPEQPVNLSVVYTGGGEDNARVLLEKLKAEYEIEDLYLGMVGPAIGTHIGPGAIGLMIQPSFDSLTTL